MRILAQAVIISKQLLAAGVYKMTVAAPKIACAASPGQFVHIKINEFNYPLLRRPISIAGIDKSAGTLTFIYRVVGEGTRLLSAKNSGERIECLGPLGQGFHLQGARPLLIGGGMGLAPLAGLAAVLCPRPLTVIMGGRTRAELFWPDIFRASCQSMHITSDDGSIGRRAFPSDILAELLTEGEFDIIYTCGPRPLMEKVAATAKRFGVACQVSLEEYMGCGLGGCLACTCASSNGKRRKVCTDGPVFWAEEVF